MANDEAPPRDLRLICELAGELADRYEYLLGAGDAKAGSASEVLDEIVRLLDDALAQANTAHPAWPMSMSMAIQAHGVRLEVTGEPADRDAAIGLLGSYLDSPAPDMMLTSDVMMTSDVMPVAEAHRRLSVLLCARYQEQPDRADLDLAIVHARRALLPDLGTDALAGNVPGSEEAGQRAMLGLLLAERYGASLDDPAESTRTDDGQEAIFQLRLARSGLAEPDDLEICSVLGFLVADRFFDQWPGEASGPADCEEALSILTVAAEASEPDMDFLVFLVRLASARLEETSGNADRETVIKWGEALLRHGQELDQDLAAFTHSTVGLALIDRAEYAADRKADLGAAIAHLEANLELAPPDDPERWCEMALLVTAYWDYINGDESEHAAMDRMTDLAIKAWPLVPLADEDRAELGFYLVTGLYEYFRRPGSGIDPGRLGLGIAVATEIEPELADPDIARVLVLIMATFQMAKAQLAGSAEAMLQAKPWILRAIEEVPADDPRWAFAAPCISTGMLLLATSGLSAEQTEKAIDVLSSVLRWPGIDPVTAARIEGSLGVILVQGSDLRTGADNLDQGIAHLRASWEGRHGRNSDRAEIALNLASALQARFSRRGDRADLDACLWYVSAVRNLVREDPSAGDGTADFDVGLAAIAGIAQVLAGHADRDLAAVDEGIANLRHAIAASLPDSLLEARTRSDLGLALLIKADLDGAVDLDAILALMQTGSTPPKGSLLRPVAALRMAGVLGAKARRTSDPALIGIAIRLLAEALDEIGHEYRERARITSTLGFMYQFRYELNGDQADIEAAVRWFEQTRDDLAGVPGHPVRGPGLIALARCYRKAGDLARAREAGLAALRERGQCVLLQTGTARGLRYAGLAASESAQVAAWCLADGDVRAAVAALELGRSQVLYAATVATGVPEMLDEIGQAELARRWRISVTASQLDQAAEPWDVTNEDSDGTPAGLDDASPRVPDDLRARVLGVLASGGRLAAPPTCEDLSAAVAKTGADALVYLLEPAGDGPGYAIILLAEGERQGAAEVLELPLLARSMSGSLEGYLAAYANWVNRAGEEPAEAKRQARHWQHALEQLCGWAWLTTMGPLLDRIGRPDLIRPPSLVLVPVGRLSVVPWQAARSATGPDPAPFACSEAVISYAASGRLLIEVSRRPALDLQAAPVIVGDPARRLPFAAAEAEAIASGCYPAARYLGQVESGGDRCADGRGTAAELLAELPAAARPGASVLHLGCHVTLVKASPPASYLQLAGGERLTIETILRQAAGRPAQAAGGLVSLAACVSDYGVATYDEALSLATAFLAGGAVTVSSARWFIDDDVTGLLMFMFHYFMTARGQSPRDALRLAQLWMLDPARTAPPEMPEDLARDVPCLGNVGIAEWAAFTHQGL